MDRTYKISLSPEFYSDTVHVSQYDSDYNIIFNVFDKYSAASSIDGMTAHFTGTRSDGLGFTFDATASGSSVSFEINTSMTAVAGTNTAEIVFYDANDLYFGSANVQVVVEPAARPNGTIDADTERAEEIAEEIQQIVDTAAATVEASLGTLSNLTTTDKSSVVAAINEVDADVSQLNTDLNAKVGTLANLTTEVKTDLVSAINEVDADVSQLNADLSSIVTKPFELTDITTLPNVQLITGYYASAGSTSVTLSTTSSYRTYYVYLTEEMTLYYSDETISSSRFVRLCTVEDAEAIAEYGTNQYIIRGSNPHQYERSAGTLPSSTNPLTLSAGTCLIFSEGNTSGVWEIYTESAPHLTNTQIEYIETQLNVKKCYLQYVEESGSDSSTARVSVYIPSVSGYVRYDILHTVSDSINADVWRVGYAYHTTDSFVSDYALTTAGEWECAIKIKDRDDYSGGYAHGDEVMNNILFIVDGVPVDITTYTTMTAFTDLAIFEDSNLYDPDDSTTVYATHGSEHHFTRNGLTIRQSVKFSVAETVTYVYLAMLPIAKTVSNYIIPDKDFVPLSTDSAIRIYNTERAVIYKSDGTVKAEFAVPKWEYLNTTDYTFFCLDNGSSEYNKCYFNNNLSSYEVASGKLIKTETYYNFVISE